MTIGTPDSRRICRHTSIPSLPGSMRSSSTRSGFDSRKASSASSPWAQKTGSKPSERSTMPIISARATSSSTTRIRPFMGLSWHPAADGTQIPPAARGTMAVMTTPEGDQSPWAQPSRPNGSGPAYGTGAGWGAAPGEPGYAPPAGQGQAAHGTPPAPVAPSSAGQPVPPSYPAPPPAAPPVGYAALRTALRPGIVPLRPLTVGEVLDGAFRSVRANPGVMFGMTALVVTIAVVAQALLQWYVQGILAGTMSRAFAGVDEELFLAETMAVSLAQLLTTTPTLGIAISVLTGLLIVSVSRSVIGQRASAAHVWEKVRPRVGALVAFSILLNLVFVLAAGLIVALVLIFAGM